MCTGSNAQAVRASHLPSIVHSKPCPLCRGHADPTPAASNTADRSEHLLYDFVEGGAMRKLLFACVCRADGRRFTFD